MKSATPFYNPVIGRFIQEDTCYGDGLNLYTYCQNNPVRYVDPSGHDSKCKLVQQITQQLSSVKDMQEYMVMLKVIHRGNIHILI